LQSVTAACSRAIRILPPNLRGFTTTAGLTLHTLTPRQIAWRLSQDLPAQQSLWLGAGVPQLLHEFTAGSNQQQPSDLAVLTADEVAATGEFSTADSTLPLLTRDCWIIAPLYRPDGTPTLVEHCSLPAMSAQTAALRATRLYTDIAIFDLKDGHAVVRALIEGITLYTLQMELDVELQISPQLTLLQIPAAMGGSY
jgi:acyl CoA:acetate/3-ketoacid CoA transferase beta subunit